MRKFFSFLTLAGLLTGGWYFASHFKIEGLDSVRVLPQDGEAGVASPEPPLPPARKGDRLLRIATFNIQAFGPTKAAVPQVMRVLTETVRQFDVVAVQDIRSRDQMFLDRFVQQVNRPDGEARPRHYRHILGPQIGRSPSKEQYAFIYDAETVEVDRASVYTIDDPADLLHRPPLVGQFRARGPAAEEAFTFILVNVHLDPDDAQQEIDALADVYRAVRQASGGEDDVILLGDFNLPVHMPLQVWDLGRLGQLSGMQAAITSEPTNAPRDKLLDNLFFHAPSTVEFTGSAGVLSIKRRFNLTSEEELAVSDHLPVWAEFTLYENAPRGRLATRSEAP